MKLQNFGILRNFLGSFRKSSAIVGSSSETLALGRKNSHAFGSEKDGRYRFYVGYLRGRSFPPKTPSFPPPPQVTILEKSSTHAKVSACEVGFPCLSTLYDKIVSQNAPDFHLSTYLFPKNFRGDAPPTLLVLLGSSWPSATQDFNLVPRVLSLTLQGVREGTLGTRL